MAIKINHRVSISGGGVSMTSQGVTREGSLSIGLEETLAASQAGSLTTRTDDNTGTITMTSGSHTIATGNTVDIYWSGGVRYGVTVGTVSGTSVPIDLGSGDVLPAAATAITIVPQVSANVSIDGDNAKYVAVILESKTKTLRTAAHIQFVDSGDAEIAELDLLANIAKVIDIDGGDSNIFTGNPITKVNISQANSTANQDYELKIVGVADATP